mmetsp:Transcript_50168/g.109041  ORF Transcript_50168/g.109041 Transcript_50168/m.109041 type:complete len:339 (-) Transcript_50168:407-1423(-)
MCSSSLTATDSTVASMLRSAREARTARFISCSKMSSSLSVSVMSVHSDAAELPPCGQGDAGVADDGATGEVRSERDEGRRLAMRRPAGESAGGGDEVVGGDDVVAGRYVGRTRGAALGGGEVVCGAGVMVSRTSPSWSSSACGVKLSTGEKVRSTGDMTVSVLSVGSMWILFGRRARRPGFLGEPSSSGRPEGPTMTPASSAARRAWRHRRPTRAVATATATSAKAPPAYSPMCHVGVPLSVLTTVVVGWVSAGLCVASQAVYREKCVVVALMVYWSVFTVVDSSSQIPLSSLRTHITIEAGSVTIDGLYVVEMMTSPPNCVPLGPNSMSGVPMPTIE